MLGRAAVLQAIGQRAEHVALLPISAEMPAELGGESALSGPASTTTPLRPQDRACKGLTTTI